MFISSNLFSSGMWRAIMESGSLHCTAQPSLSLTRPVSGARKWLGMRLQMTGVNIWTSSLGGHWGTAFLRSLRNIAAEIGIMFWQDGQRMTGDVLKKTVSEQMEKYDYSLDCEDHSRPTLSLPSSNWIIFWLEGSTKTAGNSFVLGSTCSRWTWHVCIKRRSL